jgi:hypothetical protein
MFLKLFVTVLTAEWSKNSSVCIVTKAWGG